MPSPQAQIHCGNVIPSLQALPAASVHCVVTSPPYWQARKYATESPDEIGREDRLTDYISSLLVVCKELRRVLRDDGTLWWNMGDRWHAGNLLQIPDMFALEMKSAGWMLRSSICWAKGISFRVQDCYADAPGEKEGWVGNTMPEPHAGWRWEPHRVRNDSPENAAYQNRVAAERYKRGEDHHAAAIAVCVAGERPALMRPCPGCAECAPNNGYVLKRQAWRPTAAHERLFLFTKSMDYFVNPWPILEELIYGEAGGKCFGPVCDAAAASAAGAQVRDNVSRRCNPRGRNPRDVWAIAHQGYPGHFATFPEALIAPIVDSMPALVCDQCGAPYAPVDRVDPSILDYWPTCRDCLLGKPTRATLLDPFCGSGTALVAAARRGRNAIGIDISADYCKKAEARIHDEVPDCACVVD